LDNAKNSISLFFLISVACVRGVPFVCDVLSFFFNSFGGGPHTMPRPSGFLFRPPLPQKHGSWVFPPGGAPLFAHTSFFLPLLSYFCPVVFPFLFFLQALGLGAPRPGVVPFVSAPGVHLSPRGVRGPGGDRTAGVFSARWGGGGGWCNMETQGP